MAKSLRLPPIKTPLRADSLKVARDIQQAVKEYREEVDKTRESATRESPHTTRLINSIPFIVAWLEDDTPVSLKFIAGRPHPATGLVAYAVLDREQVELFHASEFADHQWRLDGTGKKDDAAESYHIFLVRPGPRTTAASVLFALANPGVRFKEVSLADRNSFNLRRSNLDATPPDEEQRRKRKRHVPDMVPYQERIAEIIEGANQKRQLIRGGR